MTANDDRDVSKVRYWPCTECGRVFTSERAAEMHVGATECLDPSAVSGLILRPDGYRWGWDGIEPEPEMPAYLEAPDMGPAYFTPRFGGITRNDPDPEYIAGIRAVLDANTSRHANETVKVVPYRENDNRVRAPVRQPDGLRD